MKNLYYSFELFVSSDFEVRAGSSAYLILFLRKFKLLGHGEKDRIPEKLVSKKLKLSAKRTLANDMGIDKNKLIIKGDFEAKKRTKVSETPTNIEKIRDFFERPENSTQGDRTVVKFEKLTQC